MFELPVSTGNVDGKQTHVTNPYLVVSNKDISRICYMLHATCFMLIMIYLKFGAGLNFTAG